MKRITKIAENASLGKKKIRVAAYCRVSTASEEQLVSLAAQKAHYENYIKSNDNWEFAGLYYDEGISGTKKEKRDGLLAMVAACERGMIDFVITKSISRFARNTKDLLELVEQLTAKGVEFISQKEAIDTTTPTGKFMLTIFGAVAELEREYILQRQREGIAIAKTQGSYKGRKPIQNPDFTQTLLQWRSGEIKAVEAMDRLNMSKTTFYRKVQEAERAVSNG